jgi:hypothetical protein
MSKKCSKYPCCLNIQNEFLGVFSYVVLHAVPLLDTRTAVVRHLFNP